MLFITKNMNDSDFGEQTFLEIIENIKQANSDEEIIDIYNFSTFYIRNFFTRQQLHQIKARIASHHYCDEDILKYLFKTGYIGEVYNNTRFQLTLVENPVLLEELILKSDLSKCESIPSAIYELILNYDIKFRDKIFELNSSHAPDDIRLRLTLLRVNLIYH